MLHVRRYQSRGLSRLAYDAGVSKSAVSRLLAGVGQPDFLVLYRVTEALSREAGFAIDLREVAVPEGCEYPTANPCALFGCRCLPPWAYGGDGSLRSGFQGVRPGEWTDDARPGPGPLPSRGSGSPVTLPPARLPEEKRTTIQI
jgi:hypothetical protein